MLSYYAVTSLALLLSYWGRSWYKAAALVFILHSLVFGIWGTSSIAGVPQDVAREAAIFRLVAIILLSFLGFLLALAIEVPEPISQPYRGWLYDIWRLLIVLVWVGTCCAWTYAPRTWWNHLFLATLPQLLCWLFSLFVLQHARVWQRENEGWRCVLIVHWNYLVLWLLHTITFVIGETLQAPEDVWPFYYVIAITCAGCLYLVICNAGRQVRIWPYLTVAASEPSVEVNVQ
jgi:hypothetical protein